MEEIPRSNPIMLIIPMTRFTDLREYGMEENLESSVTDSIEGTESIILPRERFSKSGRWILEKLLKKPAWGEEINGKIIRAGQDYFHFAEQARHSSLQNLSDEELARLYDELAKKQEKSHAPGLPWIILEFEHQLFTRYLMRHLESRIKERGAKHSVGEVFSILTTPTEESLAQKEEKSLLRIGVKVQADEVMWSFFNKGTPAEIEAKLPVLNPVVDRMLEEHYKRFCWLPYMYEGPAWSKRYFIEVLAGLVKQNADLRGMLEKQSKQAASIEEKQEKLVAELGLDQHHARLIEIARGLVFTKGFRKDCLYHGMWCLEPLLEELEKRLRLPLKLVRRLMPWEIRPALVKRQYSREALEERWKHYVYYVHEGRRELLTGREACAFMKRLDLEKIVVEEAKDLLGNCACPGSARGIVKLVDSTEDMAKMREGDILVSHATNPDLVPAMKKAAAIVTDLGGITCHAAIVSRELKIPCVVGTKIATKALKDGDTVHVDATHGKVTKLGA
jgi:phosphoenolpyruvate synthase/pyruvate phosphate dikinase